MFSNSAQVYKSRDGTGRSTVFWLLAVGAKPCSVSTANIDYRRRRRRCCSRYLPNACRRLAPPVSVCSRPGDVPFQQIRDNNIPVPLHEITYRDAGYLYIKAHSDNS